MTLLLSRRSVLAVGASVAIPCGLRAQGSVFDTDVVVVGAGAAGLAAARQLRERGLRFVMLEARKRIGGRVYSPSLGGDIYDAGAIYIHWSERNPWSEIARAKGVAAIDEERVPGGRNLWFDKGVAGLRRPGDGFRRLSDLLDTDAGDVPDVSFIERCAGDGDLRRAAIGLARMALGEEAERVSCLDYARLWSGTDLVVPEGYGTLVQRYGADLPVRLSTPVEAIDWSGQGVRVTTPAGSLQARACIVTVPVGVLKAGSIRFTPELPEPTRSGLSGLEMGALTTIGLRFEGSRFDLPPNSEVWDSMGDRTGFSFVLWPYDRNIAVVYFGGDHAREVIRLGEAAAVEVVLEQLSKLIGPQVRSAFRMGHLNAWASDPRSLGCYSHALPGHATARARLAAPVAERLYFAGEATAAGPDGSFGAAMTAGGAFLAGKAAALAIASSMGQ